VRVQDPENGRDVPERCEATERVEPAANVAGEVGALSAHAVRPDASRAMVASDVRMCGLQRGMPPLRQSAVLPGLGSRSMLNPLPTSKSAAFSRIEPRRSLENPSPPTPLPAGGVAETFPLVYDELRQVAHRHLEREAEGFHLLDEKEPRDCVVVVEAKATTELPSDSSAPSCGLAALTESISHPASAWRVIAPVPQGSDPNACLRAMAYLKRVPDALASVRWYQ